MKFSHGEIVVVELKQGVITEVIDNNPPRYDVLILSENKVNNYAENEIEKALWVKTDDKKHIYIANAL